MNTLVALCIAPCGNGDEFAPYVAEIVKIIRASGLSNRTNSMFTEIEGEWDDVMAVVKKATQYLTDQGIRTEVILKADIRPGYTNMMDAKVESVERILEK
ncbi:MTH1187 family thiamine-binding protein [uncultured Megasphaera sp.]|uniref:MTH1187 family thiamine-binding protein n=1 Tax=uncultured Megasphaera sp. TaxID=165188 RepID=UPI0025DCDDCC|nr:MTH1187 family thiamine-binding protein [uncultured Megasphaera sp.]